MRADRKSAPSGYLTEVVGGVVRVGVWGGVPLVRHGLVSAILAAGWDPVEDLDRSNLDALIVVLNSPADLTEAPSTPATPVILLTDRSMSADYATPLVSGALSVLPIDTPVHALIHAIALSGYEISCLPRFVSESLGSAWRGDRPDWLADQQLHWLRSLADGKTVAAIAQEVGYSERAFYRLLRQLYARIGASNRSEAVAIASRWTD